MILMFSTEILEQEAISQLKAIEELVIFADEEEELQFTHCDVTKSQLFDKSIEMYGATW